MIVLNQNRIELPYFLFEKYKGKTLEIKEENSRIIIQENEDEISKLKGCLSNSKFNTETFKLMKNEEKELEL